MQNGTPINIKKITKKWLLTSRNSPSWLQKPPTGVQKEYERTVKLGWELTDFMFLTLRFYLKAIYGILKSNIYIKNPWFTHYLPKSY